MNTDKHQRAQGRWLSLLKYRWWTMLASTVALNSGLTRRITKGIPCLALNCHACPLAVTACPIGALQYFVGQQQLPLYVLGFIGLAGALGGRFACGWLCPFGWLQELVYKAPLPKWMVRPRSRARWWLLLVASAAYAAGGWGLIRFATQNPLLFAFYLVVGFVLFAFLGVSRGFALFGIVVVVALLTADTWFCKLCPAGMLEGGIPWIVLDRRLQDLVGGLYWLKLGILFFFLVWMAVTQRPFCRWICPLGAFWSPFNRWSTLYLAVDLGACVRCDRCQHVCPVDIRIYEDANAGACIRCMECVGECPVSCITIKGR